MERGKKKATQFYPHFFFIIIALEMIKGEVEMVNGEDEDEEEEG